MQKARPISVFLISVLIIVSIVVLANKQVSINLGRQYSNSALTSYSVNVNVNVDFNQDPQLLNQTTRSNIYSYITDNPGVNFRGLCSALSLPIGVVQYQINVLSKSGFISARKRGRNKRFFESRKFTDDEMKMISILKGEKAGRILEMLSENKLISHKTVAEKLEITSQDLTWHIRSLKEDNLIISSHDGKNLNYSLNEVSATTVRRCISLIKKT